MPVSCGVDQWPERFQEFILSGIKRHEIHVGMIDGVVVGTFSLTWSDPVFWGTDDSQAGYVHRLAVRTERRGAGLGQYLLNWAQTEIGRADRHLLRLDCLADNAQLRRWYQTIGFAHQRDREVEGPRGAPVLVSLYERPASPMVSH